MQDPKSGSAASLHELEHHHLEKDSVLATTPLSLQGPPETPSPHVSLSVSTHGRTFLPQVIRHRIVPHVLTNDLLATQARSAQG